MIVVEQKTPDNKGRFFMAELNLQQITDRLNSELCGENRKIVFWYDDNGEFAEDIESIELAHAKILYLEKDNQFYIKYFWI